MPEQFEEYRPSDPHSDDSSSSTDAYSRDLGMWPVNTSDSMREYWAAKGSSECRNTDADFSASSCTFEGKNYKRQCQKASSRTRMSSQTKNIFNIFI